MSAYSLPQRGPLDPRTLLLLWLAGVAALVLSTRPVLLTAELALLLGVVGTSGQGSAWLRSQRLVLALGAVVFLIALTFFGLEVALATLLRLVAVITLTFLIFQRVSPEELGAALSHLGAPYALAFLLTASLQLVPVLARIAADVRDAQRSRGLDLDAGLTSLPLYPALFLPLMVRAFLLAEELAQAMESRGFGRPGRTSLWELGMRGRDWAVVLLALLAPLAVLLLEERLPGGP